MRVVYRTDGISFSCLERAGEVDNLDIPEEEDGFEFFHGLGIIGYRQAFKMWLRKFPRPILMVALDNHTVKAWIYVEEWGEGSKDGMPVYVLRAIEVLPSLRRQGLGYKMLVLAMKETSGYMITKPLTEEAKDFFKKAGFLEPSEFRRAPIDLSKHPKYLIIPLYKKDKLIRDFSQTSGSSRT